MTGAAREAPSAYSAVTVTAVVPLSSPTRSTSARRLMAGGSGRGGGAPSSAMVTKEEAMPYPEADADTLMVSSSRSASEAATSVKSWVAAGEAEVKGDPGPAVMLITAETGVKSAASAEPPASVPSAASDTVTATFSVIGSMPSGKVAEAVKMVVEPSVTREGETATVSRRGAVMCRSADSVRKMDRTVKVSASMVSPGMSGSSTSGSRRETEITPKVMFSATSSAWSAKVVSVKVAEPLREPPSISTSKSGTAW